MLRLPNEDSSVRELFDIETLVNWKSIPDFRTTLQALRNTVSEPEIRSACGICLRHNGELWLIRVGKRGGWKKIWNFGDPTKDCHQFK